VQHGTVVAAFLCLASFIPVTDPHSTEVGLLYNISLDTEQSQNVCREQQL